MKHYPKTTKRISLSDSMSTAICFRSMTAAETAIDYVIIGMGIAG